MRQNTRAQSLLDHAAAIASAAQRMGASWSETMDTFNWERGATNVMLAFENDSTLIAWIVTFNARGKQPHYVAFFTDENDIAAGTLVKPHTTPGHAFGVFTSKRQHAFIDRRIEKTVKHTRYFFERNEETGTWSAL
jgi:hypothetical protein